MTSALYDPQYGFYTKGPAIGSQDGAFNTNAMFPAFAFALASVIQEAEILIGEPIRVVEFGGGTGQLGANITSFFGHSLEYIIIETSPSLRVQQKKHGLLTVESTELLLPGPSFVFGNEVLDALPVHRVMNDGSGQLQELYVELDEQGEFMEMPGAPSSPQLAKRLQDEDIHLGRGQIAEICLDLQDFLKKISHIVSTGYVLFIDYGDEAIDLYSHTKRNGTLRAFRSQRSMFDPFDSVGEQDLTADVDFSALRTAAEDSGFVSVGSMRQGTWLKRMGIERYMEQVEDTQNARTDIEQLTNMAHLGSTFDIQIFKTKGLPDGLGLHFT
ncbi:MAG: SAM-dependent methyltransferase [Nitrospirales bacterium]